MRAERRGEARFETAATMKAEGDWPLFGLAEQHWCRRAEGQEFVGMLLALY